MAKRPLFYFSASHEDKVFFLENLSMLISSGISIFSALEITKKEVRSAGMRYIIDCISEDVSAGYTLHEAMQRSKAFTREALSLVGIGEKSGRVKENLNIIVERLRKEEGLQSKIRSAMMYPTLILFVTLAVAILISWFILPQLANLFKGMNAQLPVVTRAVMSFGNFLVAHGVVVVPAFFAALVFLTYFIFFFTHTKFIGEYLLFAIPPTKKILQQIEISRLGYVLGTLLGAGLPIGEAIDSLQDATDSNLYRRFYKFLSQSIADGNSFQESFSYYKGSRFLIPVSIQQMIFAAEISGKISSTLVEIGKRFEEKVDVAIKDFSAILEPVMLIFVWLGVVGVALAVLLPIYNLVGNFGTLSTTPNSEPSVAIQVAPNQSVSNNIASTILRKIQISNTPQGFVNIREASSTESVVLDRALEGEKFVIVQDGQDWIKINLPDNTSGWVRKTYTTYLEE